MFADFFEKCARSSYRALWIAIPTLQRLRPSGHDPIPIVLGQNGRHICVSRCAFVQEMIHQRRECLVYVLPANGIGAAARVNALQISPETSAIHVRANEPRQKRFCPWIVEKLCAQEPIDPIRHFSAGRERHDHALEHERLVGAMFGKIDHSITFERTRPWPQIH